MACSIQLDSCLPENEDVLNALRVIQERYTALKEENTCLKQKILDLEKKLNNECNCQRAAKRKKDMDYLNRLLDPTVKFVPNNSA
jgi:cell division septum initiation protein DivIVA